MWGNISIRRVGLLSVVLFVQVCGLSIWAAPLTRYQGHAKFIRNGQPMEGNVLYVSSTEVKVSFPGKFGVPSTFKAREISEIRFDFDKLTYDFNKGTFISGADEEAKHAGPVKLINKSHQTVQLAVTSYTNHIGEKQDIDQDHDPKAVAWKVSISPDETKDFTPEGSPLVTSMLTFELVTGDGTTKETRARSGSQTPGGEFEIPIEDKDLHAPIYVEKLTAWEFHQATFHADNQDGKKQSERQVHKEFDAHSHENFDAKQGYVQPSSSLPTLTGPVGEYQSQDDQTYHSDYKKDDKRKSAYEDHAIHGDSGKSEGSGDLTATYRNPTNKTISVAVRATVELTNLRDQSKTEVKGEDLLTFGPGETKEFHIQVPGTTVNSLGAVKEVDLSSKILGGSESTK